MQLPEPRPKKFCQLRSPISLPIINKPGTDVKFNGVFNGFSVEITSENEMKLLISMGYFGKASLSRSYPQFNPGDKTEIIRNRVYQRRKHWVDANSKNKKKIIILPDSESSDNEEYFQNMTPKYQIDNSGFKETAHLTLEEAFFLHNELNCLNISYNDIMLKNSEEVWDKFLESSKNFVQNYIVYYFYRSKNWVLKPGIKFGGDFLLYKMGPPYYHASYIVAIDVVDNNLALTPRSMDTSAVLGLNRLCETAGKELLICQIICPVNVVEYPFKNLDEFVIKEVVGRRWVSTQEREIGDLS